MSDAMSMLPCIIPGSVVGIALVMAFTTKPLVLTALAIVFLLVSMRVSKSKEITFRGVLPGALLRNDPSHRSNVKRIRSSARTTGPGNTSRTLARMSTAAASG